MRRSTSWTSRRQRRCALLARLLLCSLHSFRVASPYTHASAVYYLATQLPLPERIKISSHRRNRKSAQDAWCGWRPSI